MGPLNICRTCMAYNVELFTLENKEYYKVLRFILKSKHNLDAKKVAKICQDCLEFIVKVRQFQVQSLKVEKFLSEQILNAENICPEILTKHREEINKTVLLYDGSGSRNHIEDLSKTNHSLETTDVYLGQTEIKTDEDECKNIDINNKLDPLVIANIVPKYEKPIEEDLIKPEDQNDTNNFEESYNDKDILNEYHSGNELSKGDSDVLINQDAFQDMEFDEEYDIPIVDLKKMEKALRKKNKKVLKVRDKVAVVEKGNNKTESKLPRFRSKDFKEKYADKKVLTLEQQFEEWQERRKSLAYQQALYKCEFCFNGFLDESKHRRHMMRHDESSGAYGCEVCLTRYESSAKLGAHRQRMHLYKFHCLRCEHVTKSQTNAAAHERWHQGHTYQCPACGKTFSKLTTHMNHMRNKHPTQFVCEICGKSFLSDHGIAMHKKTSHKIPQSSQTTTLESNGNTEGNKDTDNCSGDLRADEMTRFCEECDITFTSSAAYETHFYKSSKHNPSEMTSRTDCVICGLTFPDRATRLAHQKGHAGYGALKRLRSTYESARVARRPPGAPRASAARDNTYVCSECGKQFPTKCTMLRHYRRHTGEKPFKCPTCKKSFACKDYLATHSRIHEGIRPYACGLCSKSFRDKSALNRHSLVHSGRKPYECKICGRTFSQSNSVSTHVNTVHLNMPVCSSQRKRKKALPKGGNWNGLEDNSHSLDK